MTGQDVLVGDGTGKFKVRVRDGASGVLGRHEFPLDVCWEGCVPEESQGIGGWWEPDPSHA